MKLSHLFPFASAREKRAKAAFTLLELLAVVSLVGILSVLLLPAIQSASRAAGGAACVGSLRQLHSATVLYANEHDGYLPGDYWMGQIGPYLGIPTNEPSASERSRSFPVCAVALRKALAVSATTWDRYGHDNSWIRTHSMNAGLRNGMFVPDKLNMAIIPAPSVTVLYLDGHPEGGNYPYWRAATYLDSTAASSGMFPHNGRLNAVFLDGHVESRSFNEIPQDIEQSRFWNPLADGAIR